MRDREGISTRDKNISMLRKEVNKLGIKEQMAVEYIASILEPDDNDAHTIRTGYIVTVSDFAKGVGIRASAETLCEECMKILLNLSVKQFWLPYEAAPNSEMLIGWIKGASINKASRIIGIELYSGLVPYLFGTDILR